MKTWSFVIVLALLASVPAVAGSPAKTFSTSLHATRAGKAYWYGVENGGFEKWTGVPISELGCTECHGKTRADGKAYAEPYPGASCKDCHSKLGAEVAQEQCFGCHGRQATEALKMNLPDVHREAGMKCWDCHGTEDMHGDGTAYASMLEKGAIKADCGDCHGSEDLPEKHVAYDPHGGALHCTACHSSTVITCYNCHFESQVESHVKRAMKPLAGFVMLANREKDNKVHPVSFQSLTHKGNAFVAFGPYTPHATTREGRLCGDCHLNQGIGANQALEQYNRDGVIRFTTWDEDKGSLDWIKGVVPIPSDYQVSLRMEFMTFDGDTSTPPGPDAGTWSPIGKDSPDGSQLFFATALSAEQMAKLGSTVTLPMPEKLHCQGNEPFWGLQVEGDQALLKTLGEAGTVETPFAGESTALDYAHAMVWRGHSESGEGGVLVAHITRQSCADTMADEAEGGGMMDYQATVSTPGGKALLGCCREPRN